MCLIRRFGLRWGLEVELRREAGAYLFSVEPLYKNIFNVRSYFSTCVIEYLSILFLQSVHSKQPQASRIGM